MSILERPYSCYDQSLPSQFFRLWGRHWRSCRTCIVLQIWCFFLYLQSPDYIHLAENIKPLLHFPSSVEYIRSCLNCPSAFVFFHKHLLGVFESLGHFCQQKRTICNPLFSSDSFFAFFAFLGEWINSHSLRDEISLNIWDWRLSNWCTVVEKTEGEEALSSAN